MNVLGGPEAPSAISLAEGEASVFDQEDRKSDLTCHPDGRLNRIVGDHSGHDQRCDVALAQMRFEIARKKGIGSAFSKHDLAGERLRVRFERMPRTARPKGRIRFDRVVPDVEDRTTVGTPSRQKPLDIRFSLRIVVGALARPERIINLR